MSTSPCTEISFPFFTNFTLLSSSRVIDIIGSFPAGYMTLLFLLKFKIKSTLAFPLSLYHSGYGFIPIVTTESITFSSPSFFMASPSAVFI